jgi:hypothetical protein
MQVFPPSSQMGIYLIVSCAQGLQSLLVQKPERNVLVQVPDNFGEILSHPKNNIARSGHISSVRRVLWALFVLF